MLPLDTSIQRLASREKTPPINKTDYISPDFGYQSIGSKAPSKEEQNEMKQQQPQSTSIKAKKKPRNAAMAKNEKLIKLL